MRKDPFQLPLIMMRVIGCLFTGATLATGFLHSSRPRPSLVLLREGKGDFRAARELIRSVVDEAQCFSTEEGVQAFAEVCSTNVIFDDCELLGPVAGKSVRKVFSLVWCRR